MIAIFSLSASGVYICRDGYCKPGGNGERRGLPAWNIYILVQQPVWRKRIRQRNVLYYPYSLCNHYVLCGRLSGNLSFGCYSANLLAALPAPKITGSVNGDTLFCSTDASYISYQWYRNSVMMTGKTSDTLVIGTDSSDFSIVVTSSYGCTNSADYSNRSLPVELISFNAIYNGKTVDINWTTVTEINNDFFTIEKPGMGLTLFQLPGLKEPVTATRLLIIIRLMIALCPVFLPTALNKQIMTAGFKTAEWLLWM